MPFGTAVRSRRRAALVLTLAAPLLLAQQGTPPAEGQASPATTSRNQTAMFRTAVQLVTIPVVVRDAQGRAVGHLTVDDFRLFDNNKRQAIDKFAIERAPSADAPTRPQAALPTASGAAPGQAPAALIPERYTAYVFDDLHLGAADLVRAREAAAKRLATTLRPADRAAIYSMSGKTTVEFTADQDALRAGLALLAPRPARQEETGDCPEISFYQADLIVNKSDSRAMAAAMIDMRECMPASVPIDARDVAIIARRVLATGDRDSRLGLIAMRDAIRSLEVMAGQRSIILVSPGFLQHGSRSLEDELMQYAIQSRVTLNALDARGLWTDPGLDASKRMGNADTAPIRNSYASSRASEETSVMAELANGTGGRFYTNSNDLESGFQQLAAAPEVVYVLGFAPGNLKLDGKYHVLKVKLAAPKGLDVQARLGYFAPKLITDPDEQAKEEVRNALFSREELRELPINLLASGVKLPGGTSRIGVRVRVFLKDLKLRLADGRSRDEVKFATAVFDANGKLVAGQEQLVDLRLTGETLAKIGENGLITLHSESFVKPGPYLVRVVLRDNEGQQITAQNTSVQAP
jgi:VWFA-related protein